MAGSVALSTCLSSLHIWLLSMPHLQGTNYLISAEKSRCAVRLNDRLTKQGPRTSIMAKHALHTFPISLHWSKFFWVGFPLPATSAKMGHPGQQGHPACWRPLTWWLWARCYCKAKTAKPSRSTSLGGLLNATYTVAGRTRVIFTPCSS